jgi:hypothetical protein
MDGGLQSCLSCRVNGKLNENYDKIQSDLDKIREGYQHLVWDIR